MEKKKGKLIVTGKEINEVRPGTIKFDLSGVHLQKKDLFGKSDPFVVIDNGLTNDKLFTSEVIKNTLDPCWKTIRLPVSESFIIHCFDWEKIGRPELIGNCQVKLEDIKDGYQIELINKHKKKSGTLKFANIKILQTYSFLDYLSAGTQLSISIAIDYTGSNGAVTDKSSLHYIGTKERPSAQMTEYEHAMSSIGGVLEYYDKDRLFPVYGFGAKINGKLYHDFNVNFLDNPNVFGMQGVLEAYRNSIWQVELYGPTVCFY